MFISISDQHPHLPSLDCSRQVRLVLKSASDIQNFLVDGIVALFCILCLLTNSSRNFDFTNSFSFFPQRTHTTVAANAQLDINFIFLFFSPRVPVRKFFVTHKIVNISFFLQVPPLRLFRVPLFEDCSIRSSSFSHTFIF